MLKEYEWRGSTWQFDDQLAPADAKPVKRAAKTKDKAERKPPEDKAQADAPDDKAQADAPDDKAGE